MSEQEKSQKSESEGEEEMMDNKSELSEMINQQAITSKVDDQSIYPRISLKYMKNYINQIAAVVGEIEAQNGDDLYIRTKPDASDAGIITVVGYKPIPNYPIVTSVIEVRGLVLKEGQIEMHDYNAFGDKINLKRYNEMIDYWHSDIFMKFTQ